MKCRVIPIELKLKREFIVAGGRVSKKRNHIFEIDGLGLGEAAGSVHYGVTPEQIEHDLMIAVDHLKEVDPEQVLDIYTEFESHLCQPALCAVSTAWHDWLAKSNRVPLFEHLGLGAPPDIPTSITVSIGDMESMNELIESGYRHIKIKMGVNDIENKELINIINLSEGVFFRIDANGSWSLENAVQLLTKLNPKRIEILEQPFSPEAVDDWQQLRKKFQIGLFMDESIVSAEDVKRAAGYVDGVNIKIQKSGCLETAVEALKKARALGLKTMLGCMIESSVGIAAARHLSALADYLDLDGRLLIESDPFKGLNYNEGFLVNEGRFGHGVSFA